MEHLDLLRLNGFEMLVDEDADVGERVKLLAQPISKDTVFGVEGELRCVPPLPSLGADLPSRFSSRRPRRAARAHQGQLVWRDCAPIQGAQDVCQSSLPQECHVWQATDFESDVDGELLGLLLTLAAADFHSHRSYATWEGWTSPG